MGKSSNVKEDANPAQSNSIGICLCLFLVGGWMRGTLSSTESFNSRVDIPPVTCKFLAFFLNAHTSNFLTPREMSPSL